MERITISLHIPDNHVSMEKVSKDEPLINLLPPCFSMFDFVIVWNGCVLNPMFSVAFFGINDGDHIFLIPKFDQEVKQKIERRFYLLDLAGHPLFTTCPIALECARLLDNFHTRFEETGAGIRRAAKQILQSQESSDVDSFVQTEYQSTSNRPSTERLPLIWS